MMDVDKFCSRNAEGRAGRTGTALECRLSSCMHLSLLNDVIVFHWRRRERRGLRAECTVDKILIL